MLLTHIQVMQNITLGMDVFIQVNLKKHGKLKGNFFILKFQGKVKNVFKTKEND